MSVSLSISGIKPADDDFRKKLAAYRACETAGIGIPSALSDFFNNEKPDEKGVVIEISKYSSNKDIKDAISEYHGDYSGGYDIDLTKLPKDIKILRCTLG